MKRKIKKMMIGFCGLKCDHCPAFIATTNGDAVLKAKTAREWSKRYKVSHPDRPPLKPSDINCLGCLSAGPIYLYCLDCEVRRCGLKKGITSCRGCPDYQCQKLKKRQKGLF